MYIFIFFSYFTVCSTWPRNKLYITKKNVFLVVVLFRTEQLLIVCTDGIFLFSSCFTFSREVLTDMNRSRVLLIDFFFSFIGSFLFSVTSSSSKKIGIISFFFIALLWPVFFPLLLWPGFFLDYFNFITHVIVGEKIVKLGKKKKCKLTKGEIYGYMYKINNEGVGKI